MNERVHVMDRVAAVRPDPEQLDWPGQDAALLRILATPRRPEPARTRPVVRRTVLATGAAVAVAAAGVAVPIVTSGNSAPGMATADAAVINRLATAASKSGFDVPPPGGFRHFITRSRQQSSPAGTDKATKLEIRSREEWAAADGGVWAVATPSDYPGRRHDYYYFTPYAVPLKNDDRIMNAAYFASLPADPDALYDYLDGQVYGSASHQEAIYVAVTDFMRTGLPSPELRAGLIRVLGKLPVTVKENVRDALGRRAVEIRMQRPNKGGGFESVLVDPRTSAVLEERGTGIRSVVVRADVTATVPKIVRERAQVQR